jgi:hypothetical protein
MHRKFVAGLSAAVSRTPHVDVLAGGRQPARDGASIVAHAAADRKILRRDYVNDSHARDTAKINAADASDVNSRSMDVRTCSPTSLQELNK